MPTARQVGGMLLEEVVLLLLEGSGYRTVMTHQGDPTLTTERGSICVKGRGSTHQIDAIADYKFPPPFGQPHRLLVEAKLLDKPAGIEIVRNALGVHRDVSEFWIGPQFGRQGHRPRHHYQYAVFSATGFSSYAQNFAYAHDIFLLTLNDSPFLEPVVAAVREIADELAASIDENDDHSLTSARQEFRRRLRDQAGPERELYDIDIGRLLGACAEIGFGLLGMLQSRLPVLLIPHPGLNPDDVRSEEEVRIFWDARGWYLRRPDGRDLFSFSLPRQLFELYADDGTLDPARALELKGEALRTITAFQKLPDGQSRFIEFRLDEAWLNRVRRGFAERDGQ